MEKKNVSRTILKRLPIYLDYLKSLSDIPEYISASKIANGLSMGQVQVRKDLASVSDGGKPKIGYKTLELIDTLETFLGYKDIDNAIIVGAGKFGGALLEYGGFSEYGLDIVLAFDTNERIIKENNFTKKVFHVDRMKDLCKRMNVKIGIITTPVDSAQEVCDKMIECGILAILNFAPTSHLVVPDNIMIQNINIASSLALLRINLYEQQNLD